MEKFDFSPYTQRQLVGSNFGDAPLGIHLDGLSTSPRPLSTRLVPSSSESCLSKLDDFSSNSSSFPLSPFGSSLYSTSSSSSSSYTTDSLHMAADANSMSLPLSSKPLSVQRASTSASWFSYDSHEEGTLDIGLCTMNPK
ncbi:hypothetical protein ACA910_015669 [Epithemia clementina (nom. ined.)]